MSTAEADASGSRRAATPSNPIGLQRHTQSGATRRPIPVEGGLIDLFGEVMSRLSEASQHESRRKPEASEAELSQRRRGVKQDAPAEHRSNESPDPGESAESTREKDEEPCHCSVDRNNQRPEPPLVSIVTAQTGTQDSGSESPAAKPNGSAADHASHAASADARSSQTRHATDPNQPFDGNSHETATGKNRDGDNVEGSRSAENDWLASQRQQHRLQGRSALRQEGSLDAQAAKIASRLGMTTAPESPHILVARAEAAASIVESALPSTTSQVAIPAGAAGLAGLGKASSPDLPSTRMGIHRSETTRPAISGIVAGGESQPSSGAGSTSNDSAMNARSEMLARVKLISRVSKAFQHLGREGGLVRLRLAPAELGTVQVEMQVRQGHVRARVVTETEAATAALREHLPDLRARLESLGMQVERLDVETESSEQGAHFNGNDSGGWQSPSDRRGSSSGFTPRSEVRKGVESDPPATTSNSQTDTPGIDLRV